MSSFQFVALPAGQFSPLFDQSEPALRAMGARLLVVDSKPGFPCRVSLADAEVGETILALPYTHHDVSSPYLATGPIFVRKDAATSSPAADEIPLMFKHRTLSLRGYDSAAMMIAAEVVEGKDLAAAIERLFGDEAVRYLHVHNAGPGCFNCGVERVG